MDFKASFFQSNNCGLYVCYSSDKKQCVLFSKDPVAKKTFYELRVFQNLFWIFETNFSRVKRSKKILALKTILKGSGNHKVLGLKRIFWKAYRPRSRELLNQFLKTAKGYKCVHLKIGFSRTKWSQNCGH